MKIKYNAPATLTFAFLASAVLLADQFLYAPLIEQWFSAPGRGGFSPASLPDWMRMVTHPLGHAGWSHLIGNLSFILLLGPMLEEGYGSVSVLVMMVITALVTGLLNVFLFGSGLYGASGIVFMMILLASFTNFGAGEVPLTFILIVALYLGREILNAFQTNNVSEFAHIIGGLCGSLFGFFKPGRR